jgi:hypothetical protein
VIYTARKQENIAEFSKVNEMQCDKIVIVKVLELVSHTKKCIKITSVKFDGEDAR